MKIGWIGLGNIGCVMASNLMKAGGITMLVGGEKDVFEAQLLEDAMNIYLRAPGYEDFR
ncbi:hypothetical protein D1BOALGB6SA_8275 [Olavius sp. associated proteobacterium Delta 1]|nr:hypothetical protein D1BOALGB6SA_8275 [Olavius sp. associated proteobacterium Delta 1]